MPAYSYQAEFVQPTLSGQKRHTIRKERFGPRSRHARPKERLYHFVGMRTKHCRKFALSVCKHVRPIEIQFHHDGGGAVAIAGRKIFHQRNRLNRFAQADGFANWDQMRAFWKKHHPNVMHFRGVIIYWRNLQAV